MRLFYVNSTWCEFSWSVLVSSETAEKAVRKFFAEFPNAATDNVQATDVTDLERHWQKLAVEYMEKYGRKSEDGCISHFLGGYRYNI